MDLDLSSGGCIHAAAIRPDVRPNSDGCEECRARGDRWVHLRLCMSCGNVGCCEDSKNRHASAHARSADHPIVRSFEPGEDWMWCYPDQTWVDPPLV